MIFTPSGMYETKEERTTRIRSAIALLKELAAEKPESDTCHALLGVSYYFLLGDDPDASGDKVINALSTALSINPENLLGLMYMAFQKFDDEKYPETIALVAGISRHRDYLNLEIWQRMKLKEIELSSRIFMTPGTITASDIIELSKELQRTRKEERAPLLELLKALKINGL